MQVILNRSIQPIDGTLTKTISVNQNGPESNGNEEILQIFKGPEW